VLEELGYNIDIVSLAKREEEVYKPGSNEPIVLGRSHFGLKLLQSVRDESHRFAITFHRNKRAKAMVKSELENIAGVGQTTITKLLDIYKNIDNIRNATIADMVLNKINKNIAKNIYNYFHEN
jgi:excinuclease ABC subunit C